MRNGGDKSLFRERRIGRRSSAVQHVRSGNCRQGERGLRGGRGGANRGRRGSGQGGGGECRID